MRRKRSPSLLLSVKLVAVKTGEERYHLALPFGERYLYRVGMCFVAVKDTSVIVRILQQLLV